MVKNRRILLICSAVLGGALTAVAHAQDSSIRFDQGADVGKIVGEARKSAAESSGPALPGRPVAAQNLDDSIERRIVVFKKGTSRSRRMNLVRNTGGIPTKDLWLINAVAVIVPKVKAASVDRRLASLSEVTRVEKDYVQNWLLNAAAARLPFSSRAVPAAIITGGTPANQEEGEDEAGQTPDWGWTRVNAKGAWGVTRGAGVKVGDIDTGIDFDHPEIETAGGYNAIDNAVSYKDDNGHGTHVSGTIAAKDNDTGVVGIAPDVMLYGVKVLNARGSGTFAGVIDGIQWAVKNGMDVANMSLGASRGTDALAEAIANAKAAGTIIIAAAGNSGGSVGFPAAYPEAIAIAASDSSDKIAYFSSRGPQVELVAPGVGVNSTWLGGGYRKISGTSMACPHVTGLAALAVANGADSWDAVLAALKGAATKLEGDIPGEQQGAGMVDAGKLVQ